MPEEFVLKLKTQPIHFTKKPAKTGRNYAFYIPLAYINNGLIDPTKKYRVYLERVEE